MQSLFLISVQKTPDTEAMSDTIDDRNSTSYYGIKYSCSHTG